MARFGWPTAMPFFSPVLMMATLLLVALTGADQTSPTPQATPMTVDSGASAFAALNMTVDSGASAFAAFSAVAARRSPLDVVALYADDANIVSWNAATGTGSRYNGTDDIIKFWEKLFVFFDPEACGPEPPFISETNPTTAFEAWPCRPCGIVMGSDSLVFDSDAGFAIIQHNAVFDWPGVDISAWQLLNPSYPTCAASNATVVSPTTTNAPDDDDDDGNDDGGELDDHRITIANDVEIGVVVVIAIAACAVGIIYHLAVRGGKFAKRWNRKQDHQVDHHHEQRLCAIRNELAEESEALTAAADVHVDTTPPTYASA